jgi:hypothetical protein
LRKPLSARPGSVSCRILSQTGREGFTERHGLINVSPDDAALRVIKKLNGACPKTKRVGVSKYCRLTGEPLCVSGELIQAQ